MRIGAKLLAGTAGVVGIFGAVVLTGLHQGISRILTDELGRRGLTIAETLAGPVESALVTENVVLLRDVLQEDLAGHKDVRYIFVLDRNGKAAGQTLGSGLPLGLREANVLGPGQRSQTRPSSPRKVGSGRRPIPAPGGDENHRVGMLGTA